MVVSTLIIAASLLVIFLFPNTFNNSENNANNASSSLASSMMVSAANTTTSSMTSQTVGEAWSRMRKHRLRSARIHQQQLEQQQILDGVRQNCNDGNSVCCSEPVSKVTAVRVLSLSKLIPLESNKHYLVRHVRLMRCPTKHGCCANWREHCAPTETADVSVEIPVEVSIGESAFTYVNETHYFHNHVKCGCKKRSKQALANYLSRELISEFNPDDALDVTKRICKAVQRRIRKLQRYDERFRSNAKRKSRPGRSLVC